MFSSTTIIALVIRILIALCTRTVFQPDEYFQSLEPAHYLVFGYGELTWEWLTPQPIRSILYPALNVPVYWFLKVTGLHDWGSLIIFGPRILHGAFAALTDLALCELTRRTIGERYVSTTFLLSITSFFHALSLSRSLSNSLETSLTTIALSMYPWQDSTQTFMSRTSIRAMLLFASLACAIRATNAVIWVYLVPLLFWRLRNQKDAILGVLRDCVLTGGTTLAAMTLVDSMFYGRPTFTPLNFLRTNLSGVSLFYGSSPWHYYLSQGLPILCTTSLPFALHGMWSASAEPLITLRGLVLWTIGVYSFAGHKEWRFIHPILPVLHLFAAKTLVDAFSFSRSSPKGEGEKEKARFNIHKPILYLLLANIPVSLYIVLFYCSAPISVLGYIRSLPSSDLDRGVGFLMPCHSTPGHAYIHRPQLANGRMWSLGCEPPLEGQNLTTYRDQTTVFFDDPHRYISERFPERVNSTFPKSSSSRPTLMLPSAPWVHEWPLHLVFFGSLLERDGVKDLLIARGYKKVWKRGRAWEGDQDERKGGVEVWKWTL